MSDPTKELTLEERIKSEIESVEQQYRENRQEVSKIRKLLNQRVNHGLELAGQYKALSALIPETEDAEKLQDESLKDEE